MALKSDKDGFLQGTPVAVERGSFDRAIAVWQSIKGDTKAIRKAIDGGPTAAVPGRAAPIYSDRQVKHIADKIASAVKTVAETQVPAGGGQRRTKRTAQPAAIPGAAPAAGDSPASSGGVPPQNRNLPNNMKERPESLPERDGKGRFRGDGSGGGDGGGNSEITRAIKDGFDAAGTDIEDLDPVIKASKETKEIAENAVGLAKGTANVFKGIWSIGKRGFGIGRAIVTVLAGRGDKQLPWLKRILKELRRSNERPVGGGGGSGLMGMLLPVLGGVISFLTPVVMGLLGAAVPFVLPALAGVVGALIGDWIYKKFGPQINAAIDGTVEFLRSSWEGLIDGASKVFDWIGEKAGKAKAVYAGAVDLTSRGIEGAANLTSGAANWLGGKMGRRVKQDWSGVKGGEGLALGTYTNEEAAAIRGLKGSGANTSANIGGMPADIKRKIIEQAMANGLDPQTMLKMANMESGGNPNAVSSTGAIGVYQFVGKTASGVGIKNRFNADENIAGAMALTKQNQAMLKKAGLPATEANLYMMHQLGPRAVELIRGAGDGKSVSQLSPELRKSMGMNYGASSLTASDYISRNTAKLNSVSSLGAAPSQSAAISADSVAAPKAASVTIPLSSARATQTTVKVTQPVGQNLSDRSIAQVATGGIGGK